MRALQLGDPLQSGTDLGPQADKLQAAVVARYLEIGSHHGRALVGGSKASNVGENYIQPTIFTDVPDQSALNVEEVFGPVVVVHEFEDDEEAYRRANDTDCTTFLSI